MSGVPVLTFFNNKGGVGKTSLVYHLAWKFSELGKRVVAIDLDPQANLSAAFLDEDELEELWSDDTPGERNRTVFQCVRPLTEMGDIRAPRVRPIAARLHLVPGDLALAGFEDFLSQEWPNALRGDNLLRPFRVTSSLWQVGQMAAAEQGADIVLADVGPNLGAINRSALIGTDHVVVPLAADLFSIQGLRNLGPTLHAWRTEWAKRLTNWTAPAFGLPTGAMQPAGYVLLQHMERLSRPVKAYQKWADRMPEIYHQSVLRQDAAAPAADHCLARLKHYRSLMPLAQEARKPVFHLSAAEGAIGSHFYAVREAGEDFKKLALTILERIGLPA